MIGATQEMRTKLVAAVNSKPPHDMFKVTWDSSFHIYCLLQILGRFFAVMARWFRGDWLRNSRNGQQRFEP